MAGNRVLKKKLGMKRIPLTDDDRRVQAVTGKALGRRLLEHVATIVTPDTPESGEIQCRERLDGLLRYYHREAALRHQARRHPVSRSLQITFRQLPRACSVMKDLRYRRNMLERSPAP